MPSSTREDPNPSSVGPVKGGVVGAPESQMVSCKRTQKECSFSPASAPNRAVGKDPSHTRLCRGKQWGREHWARREPGLAISCTMSAHSTRGRPHVTRLTRRAPTGDGRNGVSATNGAMGMHRARNEARPTGVRNSGNDAAVPELWSTLHRRRVARSPRPGLPWAPDRNATQRIHDGVLSVRRGRTHDALDSRSGTRGLQKAPSRRGSRIASMVIPRRETYTVWLHLTSSSVLGASIVGYSGHADHRMVNAGELQAEATPLGRNPTSEGVWLMGYERHFLAEIM